MSKIVSIERSVGLVCVSRYKSMYIRNSFWKITNLQHVNNWHSARTVRKRLSTDIFIGCMMPKCHSTYAVCHIQSVYGNYE